jgi:hypothetical protein
MSWDTLLPDDILLGEGCVEHWLVVDERDLFVDACKFLS